jgi:hypothetical protein
MQTGVISVSEIRDSEQIGEGGADINVSSYFRYNHSTKIFVFSLNYDQEQFLVLSSLYLGESQVSTRINE